MPPLVIAALVVLFEGLSLSALFPVIHAYAEQLGGNAIWIGVLFALVPAPKIIFNPLWGWLSDRFGRKPVLITITIGSTLGSVGWAVVPSLMWLALVRAFAGVFGAQAAVASAIAADVSTVMRRAASMAALGMAFGVAFTVGPALGGWFGDAFGYAHVGWLCASFQFTSLMFITFALRETHPPKAEAHARRPSRTMWRMALAREVFGPLMVTVLMTIALSELIATFGKLTQLRYGFSAHQTGYGLSLLGLLGALTQGGIRSAVKRIGERGLAAVSIVIMSLGLAMIGAGLSEGWFWVALGLVAVGSAAATTCISAILSQNVDEREQGAIQGLNQSVTGFGRALGFAVGGVLFAKLGASSPYLSAAGLALLAVLFVVLTPRREAIAVPAGGHSAG